MNQSNLPNYLQIQSGVRLIGIHGHARTGKDSIANYLNRTRPDTWGLAFATPLKDACAKMFGIPEELFYDDQAKETKDPFWGVSPREIAQFVGTELVRNRIGELFGHYGENFWIRRATLTLNGHESNGPVYNSDDTVVITDVRFQNEYHWVIANKGIIIHLTRPGSDGNIGIPNHASEIGIQFITNERTYLVENTGTLEELYAKVDEIVNKSGIYPFHSTEQF